MGLVLPLVQVNQKPITMNTGIKNKLKTLIGEEVNFHNDSDSHVMIVYPSFHDKDSYKILGIEGEDCVVLGRGGQEIFLSIDHISYLNIYKKVI